MRKTPAADRFSTGAQHGHPRPLNSGPDPLVQYRPLPGPPVSCVCRRENACKASPSHSASGAIARCSVECGVTRYVLRRPASFSRFVRHCIHVHETAAQLYLKLPLFSLHFCSRTASRSLFTCGGCRKAKLGSLSTYASSACRFVSSCKRRVASYQFKYTSAH